MTAVDSYAGAPAAAPALDWSSLVRQSEALASNLLDIQSSALSRTNLQQQTDGTNTKSTTTEPDLPIPTPLILQRNVAQLDLTTRKLLTALRPTHKEDVQTLANTFLSTRGVDVGRAYQVLKQLNLRNVYEAVDPTVLHQQHSYHAPHLPSLSPQPSAATQLPLHQYLQHHSQHALTSAIQHTTRHTFHVQQRHMDSEWQQTKREILDGLEFRTQQQSGVYQMNAMSTEGSMQNVGAQQQQLSVEQQTYAAIILELNKRRRQNQPFSIVTELLRAAHAIEDYYQQQNRIEASATAGDVEDVFDLLKDIAHEHRDNNDATHATVMDSTDGTHHRDHRTKSNPLYPDLHLAASEQQYADLYQNNDIHLQCVLVDGTFQYTERLFTTYMQQTIRSNADRAMRTGLPGIIHDVRALMNVNGINKQAQPQLHLQDEFESYPLWPQVYYTYRSGQYEAAVDLLNKAAEYQKLVAPTQTASATASHSLYNLAVVLGARDDHDKSPAVMHAWRELAEAYNRDISTQSRADLYKVAIYAIAGYFKLSNTHQQEITRYITNTTEDYMWFRLKLLWLDTHHKLPSWLYTTQAEQSSVTLSALQRRITTELGESYFNRDGKHPLNYFKVLLMSLQFEYAIYYLLRTDLYIVALHCAIALNYYGLLRINTQQRELYTQLNATHSVINLSRAVRKYIQPLIRTSPEQCFHYIYVLHHSTTPDKPQLIDADNDSSDTVLVDLITSARDYDLLVGTVTQTAVIKQGLVYQYYQEQEAFEVIALAAARQVEQSNTIDAVQLYTLCELYDAAAQILIQQLATLATSMAQDQQRQTLVELTQDFVTLCQSSGVQITTRAPSNKRLNRGNSTAVVLVSTQQEPGTIDERNLLSLTLLIKLIQFFDLYNVGSSQYDDALTIIHSLQLFPTPSYKHPQVDQDDAIERFKALDNSAVQRVIINAAVAAMQIYSNRYHALKHGNQGGGGGGGALSYLSRLTPFAGNTRQSADVRQMVEEFKQRASLLVTFLGRQPLSVDSSIMTNLINLESTMA